MLTTEHTKANFLQHKILLREDIVMWPLAFMMFASTNTMWYFLTPKAVVLTYEIFSIFLPILFFAARRRLILSCRFPISKLAFITLYLMAFAPGALHQGTLPNLAYRMFAQLLPLIVLFATMKPRELRLLFVRFEKIVLLFATISIPCWLAFCVFDAVKPLTFSEYSWGGGSIPNYYWIHFGAQGYRNCSIFAEAPMFNLVLCAALFVELFLRKETSRLRLAILLLADMTTMTTTGLLIMMLSLFVRYAIIPKRKGGILMRFGLAIVLISATAFVIIAGSHLLAEKHGGHSWTVRMLKMTTEFAAFKTSPILGHGFGSYLMGTSNSFTLVLAEGGLALFALYLYSLVAWPMYATKQAFRYLWPLYYLVFSITVSPYIPLTFVFVASSLCHHLKPRNEWVALFKQQDKRRMQNRTQ